MSRKIKNIIQDIERTARDDGQLEKSLEALNPFLKSVPLLSLLSFDCLVDVLHCRERVRTQDNLVQFMDIAGDDDGVVICLFDILFYLLFQIL